MFSIGPAEFVIVGVLGLFLFGLMAGVVVVLVLATRRGSDVAALKAENQALREQLSTTQGDRLS